MSDPHIQHSQQPSNYPNEIINQMPINDYNNYQSNNPYNHVNHSNPGMEQGPPMNSSNQQNIPSCFQCRSIGDPSQLRSCSNCSTPIHLTCLGVTGGLCPACGSVLSPQHSQSQMSQMALNNNNHVPQQNQTINNNVNPQSQQNNPQQNSMDPAMIQQMQQQVMYMMAMQSQFMPNAMYPFMNNGNNTGNTTGPAAGPQSQAHPNSQSGHMQAPYNMGLDPNANQIKTQAGVPGQVGMNPADLNANVKRKRSAKYNINAADPEDAEYNEDEDWTPAPTEPPNQFDMNRKLIIGNGSNPNMANGMNGMMMQNNNMHMFSPFNFPYGFPQQPVANVSSKPLRPDRSGSLSGQRKTSSRTGGFYDSARRTEEEDSDDEPTLELPIPTPDKVRRSVRNRKSKKEDDLLTMTKEEEKQLESALKNSVVEIQKINALEAVPEAPVFRPSFEEFKDPIAFIRKIRAEGSKYGLVKIIPPPGWNPPKTLDTSKLTFPTRHQRIDRLQQAVGFDNGNSYGWADYKAMAEKFERNFWNNKGRDYNHVSPADAEREYWNIVETASSTVAVEYGNDLDSMVHSSCFEKLDCDKVVEAVYGPDLVRKHVHEKNSNLPSPNRPITRSRYTNVYHHVPNPTPTTVSIDQSSLEAVLSALDPKVAAEALQAEQSLLGVTIDSNSASKNLSSSIPLNSSPGPTRLIADLPPPPPPVYQSTPPALFGQSISPYAGGESWNLNVLPFLPGSLLRNVTEQINGITVPWVYIGMLFATFCWHNEDDYLYSINYHHAGAPKTWYGVPGKKAESFERVMRQAVRQLFDSEPDLMMKLVTMISPSLLIANKIPVVRSVQNAGEFIITFPKSYHGGFSCGFNYGEAVNFCIDDWLPLGREAEARYRRFRRSSVFSHDHLLMRTIFNEPQLHDAELLFNEFESLRLHEIKLREACATWGIMKSEKFTEFSIDDRLDSGTQCYYCLHYCWLSWVTCSNPNCKLTHTTVTTSTTSSSTSSTITNASNPTSTSESVSPDEKKPIQISEENNSAVDNPDSKSDFANEDSKTVKSDPSESTSTSTPNPAPVPVPVLASSTSTSSGKVTTISANGRICCLDHARMLCHCDRPTYYVLRYRYSIDDLENMSKSLKNVLDDQLAKRPILPGAVPQPNNDLHHQSLTNSINDSTHSTGLSSIPIPEGPIADNNNGVYGNMFDPYNPHHSQTSQQQQSMMNPHLLSMMNHNFPNNSSNLNMLQQPQQPVKIQSSSSKSKKKRKRRVVDEEWYPSEEEGYDQMHGHSRRNDDDDEDYENDEDEVDPVLEVEAALAVEQAKLNAQQQHQQMTNNLLAQSNNNNPLMSIFGQMPMGVNDVNMNVHGGNNNLMNAFGQQQQPYFFSLNQFMNHPHQNNHNQNNFNSNAVNSVLMQQQLHHQYMPGLNNGLNGLVQPVQQLVGLNSLNNMNNLNFQQQQVGHHSNMNNVNVPLQLPLTNVVNGVNVGMVQHSHNLNQMPMVNVNQNNMYDGHV